MADYSQALAAAIDAARRAGCLLREEFHRPGGPRGGGSHAEIDEVAERAIRDCLQSAFPWGFRGEETGHHPGDGGAHLWLVDPHDGTSVYLTGRRGTAVSIAALRDGVPILGVVYAFNYPDDDGDLLCWAEGCGPLRRNDQPQPQLPREMPSAADPSQIVLLWMGADSNALTAIRCVAPYRYATLPSIAHRLALAAVGSGVCSVSVNGPLGWDYAAGHALLRGAGGAFLNQRGEPINYTRDGQSYASRCFGGQPAVVESLWPRDWSSMLASGGRSPRGSFSLARPVPGETMPRADVLRRAQGCLLGQFAGDSLGSRVEFQSAQRIRAAFPDGVRDLADGGVWNILAGQPTDDSELALMLARALVREHRFDPAAVLESYVTWYLSRPFDIGTTTAAALSAAARGATHGDRLRMAHEEANSQSQANGSLMRISPLGIFAAGASLDGICWAREDSRLTHPHPVCQDACAVFVAAIARAVAEGESPTGIYEQSLRTAEEQGFCAEVVESLRRAADEVPADFFSQQGWVLIALQNAFYRLLRAESLEEGVVETVMAGGDTDTNAAIAGALLGAVHGRDAVPRRWIRAVLSARPLRRASTDHPRPIEFWPVDALELAEALLVAGGRIRP